jgi:hypothetical protein
MIFTKKLRDRVKSGEVTASVRIWRGPRVKAGNRYRLEEGHIQVTSIREITWEDLSDKLARDTGFRNLIDLMKTAKHGSGQHVYFIRFRYEEIPTLPTNRPLPTDRRERRRRAISSRQSRLPGDT